MKRIAGLILFMGVTTNVAFSATSLHFHIPTGWLDVSPGVPPESVTVLKPSIVKELQAPGNIFAAVDLTSKSQNLLSSVYVREQDYAMVINDISMKIAANKMKDSTAETHPTWKVKILFSGTMKIGVVTCGRMVCDTLKDDGIPVVEAGYFLPDGGKTAVMNFACLSQDFKAKEKAFDAFASATTGIHEGSGFAARTVGAPFHAVGPATRLTADTALFDIIDPAILASTVGSMVLPQARPVFADALLTPR